MTSPPRTAPAAGTPPVLRITRGAPDREELTALTLALLSRARDVPVPPGGPVPAAGWRPAGRYRQAGSWAVLRNGRA